MSLSHISRFRVTGDVACRPTVLKRMFCAGKSIPELIWIQNLVSLSTSSEAELCFWTITGDKKHKI